MPNDILSAMQEATKDLLYMSESDEPFAIVHWREARGEPTGEGVLMLAGHNRNEPVSEVLVDEFFKPLIEQKKWHEEQERADVQRYRKLHETLKKHLSSVKVFRVGEIELDIYIVGKTPEGHWAGVKTKAVET